MQIMFWPRTVLFISSFLSAFGAFTVAATAAMDAESVNTAEYSGDALPTGQSALTARVQIMLDRIGASPGVIDGYQGDNVLKAIMAVEMMHDLEVDGKMDSEVWNRLLSDPREVMIRYTITEEDGDDIVEELPEDYAELAELEWIGYTSVAEKLAERFHMDIDFLKAVNPDADFTASGTEIWVAETGEPMKAEIAEIIVDKSLSRVLARNADGKLVVSYPATIGSAQTPSPSGTHEIVTTAIDPNYYYRPDENFIQGENTESLTLPPGPNGPVGSVWIDLSEPTYGIHGTPEPAEIDKTASHGCVRLTNWDARELASIVSSGITVEFKE